MYFGWLASIIDTQVLHQLNKVTGERFNEPEVIKMLGEFEGCSGFFRSLPCATGTDDVILEIFMKLGRADQVVEGVGIHVP